MSLEIAIAKLTTAVERLTAELEVRWGIPPAPTADVKQSPAPSNEGVGTSAAAPAETPQVVTYDAAAVSAKAAINRPALVALLAQFGAKRGPEVPEADWPKFFEALAKIEKAAA